MKKMIAFALVALMILPALAFAQTIAISAAQPDSTSPLVQFFDTPSGAFEVVIWMDMAGFDSNAGEFVMTELLNIVPGIFKLSIVKVNNALDLGNNLDGEYLLAFKACLPASTNLEIVRVQYGDFGGATPADLVMSLRGFQPGDSQPSTFGGEPGFVDCSQGKHVLVQGGVDGGTTGVDGGITGPGVVFPDGTLVLNPTPTVVPVEDGSMGQLKARF